MTPLVVRRAGVVPYEAGLALQADLVAARKADAIPDTLVLLQHPPVITLGVKVRQSREHVLASDDDLRAMSVDFSSRLAAEATSPTTARDNWSAIPSST